MAIARLRLLTAAAAVLFVYLLWHSGYERLQPLVRTFAGILLDALPYLALGSLVSALLHLYVPDRFIGKLTPRNKLLGVLFGSLLGLAVPLCECGMIPVVRSLIRKGLPSYIAIVYLAAGPILNPVVIAATFAAFRADPSIAYARFGLAFAVTVALGLMLSVLLRRSPLKDAAATGPNAGHRHEHEHGHKHGHESKSGHKHGHGHAHGDEHGHDHSHGHGHGHAHTHHRGPRPVSFSGRLGEIASHAFEDLWDMGKLLLLGAFITAIVQSLVDQSTFAAIAGRDLLSHLFMMGFAFLLSLCSTADAFVAASFVHQFPPGALLSFLVIGPMFDLKSSLLMLSVFRKRFVLQFALLVFWLVLVGSHLWERMGWVS